MNPIEVIILFFAGLWKDVLRVVSIIKRNIKLLLRSKSSALVVIFCPLVVITLIVIAFNNAAIFDISVPAYSQSYSPLSEDLLSQLKSEQYSITKVSSLDACTEGVKK